MASQVPEDRKSALQRARKDTYATAHDHHASVFRQSDYEHNPLTHVKRHNYDVRELTTYPARRDLAHRFPALHQVVDRQISRFTIEFLDTDVLKPHVVFRFFFEEPVRSPQNPNELFASIRLSMEPYQAGEGEHEQPGPGAGQIHLHGNYDSRSKRATAAFEFPIAKGRTLSMIVSVLGGQWTVKDLPERMQSSLFVFHFVWVIQSSAEELADGCRD